MKSNQVNSQPMQDTGAAGLKIAPQVEHAGPDRDSVASMVRHAVGPVLDGLAEAKGDICAAQRLRRTAGAVGDEEVERMIAGELRSLSAAARIES